MRSLRRSGVPHARVPRLDRDRLREASSFEMIRSLVERLPVMITPKWVKVPAQPIAIDDLLEYLLARFACRSLGLPLFEIGGSDQVSYADIIRVYARQRGLRRRMLPVPVLTPYLSSLWLGLVTPLYTRVGRKLIESIVHPSGRDATPPALRTFAVSPWRVEAIRAPSRAKSGIRGATGGPMLSPRW